MRTVVSLVMTIWIVALGVGTAAADDVSGALGTPLSLQINTSAGDIHLQYHGRLFVRNTEGGIDEYRWGGTSCGSRTLTEPQMAALQRAIADKRIRVAPVFQDGQGSSKCLVGFQLTPKSFLKFLP